MNTSSRKEKEKNRKGGEGKRGDEKVELMNGVYKGLGDLSPHELQPVGEKLTESVAQPCSILCTANHNFKISTSECIRYPPKCAFSRVSNDFFWGGGSPALPCTPPSSAHSRAFDAQSKAQNSERNENWYPHF